MEWPNKERRAHLFLCLLLNFPPPAPPPSADLRHLAWPLIWSKLQPSQFVRPLALCVKFNRAPARDKLWLASALQLRAYLESFASLELALSTQAANVNGAPVRLLDF